MTKNSNDFTKICYEDDADKKECNDPLTPVNSASGYVVDVDKKNNKL